MSRDCVGISRKMLGHNEKIRGLVAISSLFGKLSWFRLLVFWIVFQIVGAGVVAVMSG